MIHIGIVGGGNISETHARGAGEIAGLSIAAFTATTASARRASRRRMAHLHTMSSSDFSIIARSTWW